MNTGSSPGAGQLWRASTIPGRLSGTDSPAPRLVASLLRLASALARTGFALARLRAGTPGTRVLAQWLPGFLQALRLDLRLSAPVPEGGQLWVCNHLSWLDPLLCFRCRPSGSLAKAEVAAYPVVGSALPRIGLRFVERENPLSRAAALVRLAADLRRGESMLVFPEGTTTRGHCLAPLHEGSLRAAYRLGVPVLPLRLSCAEAHYTWVGDDSLLPHLWSLVRRERTTVELHPGPRLLPSDFSSEPRWLEAIQAHLEPHPTDPRGSH